MIKFILSISVVVILGIYTIFSDLVCFLIRDKEKVLNYNYKVVRFVFNLVLKIDGISIEVFGKENLDRLAKDEPIFIISNHRGYFDILTGYKVLDRNCCIVAKDSLAKIPILGYWMKKINCLFLDRKNLRSGATMVLNAIKYINEGRSVWIFPEGTRNTNSDPTEILPFRAGVFKIPEKTNCYIVPMAIYNSDEVFEKHMPRVKATKVKIAIGEAYKISELGEGDRLNIDKYSENKTGRNPAISFAPSFAQARVGSGATSEKVVNMMPCASSDFSTGTV